jgi:tRNA dimethylallyltransferase
MAGLILIGGPTASGKSSLALRVAETAGGVVINADSMQLYRDLAILTARPGADEEPRAPHRLYGILDAAVSASVAAWLELAAREIERAAAAGRLAVVVGGTGLYLHALLHGLAPVPDVPAAVREETLAMLAALGSGGLHVELARRDPVMGERLRPSDAQRVVRAYEVVAATGRSLAAWQADPPLRVDLPEDRAAFVLVPPRALLHQRIAQRLHAMIEAGALDEVAALRARNLNPQLPAMKALAVPQLCAHLDGRLDLEQAMADAITQTRRYAKRQLTWFRHQLPELRPIETFGEDPAALDELLGAAAAVDRHRPPS